MTALFPAPLAARTKKKQAVSIYGWREGARPSALKTFISRESERDSFLFRGGMKIICLLSKTGPTGCGLYNLGQGCRRCGRTRDGRMGMFSRAHPLLFSGSDDYSAVAAAREGGWMRAIISLSAALLLN